MRCLRRNALGCDMGIGKACKKTAGLTAPIVMEGLFAGWLSLEFWSSDKQCGCENSLGTIPGEIRLSAWKQAFIMKIYCGLLLLVAVGQADMFGCATGKWI